MLHVEHRRSHITCWKMNENLLPQVCSLLDSASVLMMLLYPSFAIQLVSFDGHDDNSAKDGYG